MAPEHPSAAAAVSQLDASLMQQDPEPQQPQEQVNGQTLIQRPKTPGSSRRGKQYKCGNCQELGHNTKTCPRRTSLADGSAATIQPALDSDMFGVGNLGTPVSSHLRGTGLTGPVPPVSTRVTPLKLEAALEAANRRVLAAETAVASAQTAEEFEEATSALDASVAQLERIAACARRCAFVAYSLSTPGLDISPSNGTRDAKRQRIDNGSHPNNQNSTQVQMQAQPIAPRMEGVDNVTQVQNVPKEETVGAQADNIDEALE